jgi:hypothetical protein
MAPRNYRTLGGHIGLLVWGTTGGGECRKALHVRNTAGPTLAIHKKLNTGSNSEHYLSAAC